MDDWLTAILIVLPVAGALVLALVPLPRAAAGSFAALVSLVEVGFWISAASRFRFGDPSLQMDQRASWFRDLGVSWHIGMYAFSLWLVGLTVVSMAACTIYGWWVGRDRARAYFALMLLLTGAIVGVFTAQDLLVFYAFFEAMLIPLYVLIGVWGGSDRMRATITFVVYTVVGSLLMLAAIVVYGLQQGTFDLTKLHQSSSVWLFLGFAVAFAIKAPLAPFHGWLPTAYRESPPEVAAVLSGVISKVGLYGLLRIAIPTFPHAVHDFRVVALVLASVSLVYGSLLAFRAPDFRGVVAYSSLAQSGLIVLGLFANNDLGLDGSVLQMVNHGLVSTSLFLLAGMIERRAATGDLRLLGGMARGRPALATVLMTVGVISLAVPLSTSFAGEFLILAGVFQQGWAWAVVGAVAIVLAAMYMLRVISAVLHQDVGPAVPDAALDLRLGELAVVVPLVLCLLGLSAWPNLVSGHSFGGGKAQDQVNAGLRLSAHHLPHGVGAFEATVSCTAACHVFTIVSGDTAYTGIAPGDPSHGGWTSYVPLGAK
jgi:NADH-quinone oxidoreductase subunit M